MSNKKKAAHYVCPDCGSEELLVYEECCFKLNTLEFYCMTIKSSDLHAKISCQNCDFTGIKKDLILNEE